MTARWANTTAPSGGIKRGREHYEIHPYISALNAASRAIIWLVEVDAAQYSQVRGKLGPLAPSSAMPNASLLMGVRPTIATVKLRWATRPFVSADDDAPAKTFIDGRLVAPSILRELGTVQDGSWGSLVRVDVGEVELSNDDGELDNLGINYTFEGRRVRIYAGAAGTDRFGVDHAPSIRSMAIVYTGEVERWSYSRNSVRLIIRNRPAGFDKLVQGNTYAGHGGSSGSASLAGVSRPLAFGPCFNVPAVLVDQEQLIYQVHDGEVRGIDAVRVSGAELTLAFDVPTYKELEEVAPLDPETGGELGLSYYATCLSEGYIKLSILAYGSVTVDVRGAGSRFYGFSGTWEGGRLWEGKRRWALKGSRIYRDRAAGIAGDILVNYGGLAITRSSFDRLDADFGRQSGVFIGPGDSITVADLTERLLRSVPAMLVQDVGGRWWARQLAPPSNDPKTTIGALEIVRSGGGPEVDRPDLPYGRPWPSWRVSYHRNWHVMTEEELVFAVSGDTRVFLTQAAREVSRSDQTLGLFYIDRPGAIFDGYLIEKIDADSLLDKLFLLYGRDRRMFRVTVKGHMFLHDIGDTLAVNFHRYGLSGLTTLDTGDGDLAIDVYGDELLVGTGPQRFVVVGLKEDGVARSTELTLWG